MPEIKQQTTKSNTGAKDKQTKRCEEIEELDKQEKQDQMKIYKTTNGLNRKSRPISVEDKNSKLLTDPELVKSDEQNTQKNCMLQTANLKT